MSDKFENFIYMVSKASVCFFPKKAWRIKLRTKVDLFLNLLLRTEKATYYKKFTKIVAENRQNNKAYQVCSLGTTCYSRVFSTLWGFKPRKEEGELTCPFDLSITPLSAVVHFLNNRFSDYFENISFNGEYWINEKFNIKFVHDKVNDSSAFVALFKKRIENFYSMIQTNLPVLFVCHVMDKEEFEEIGNLYQILKIIRQNKKMKLVIINYSGTFLEPADDIHIYNQKLLRPDCEYMAKQMQYHKEGFEFEYPLMVEFKKLSKS